MSFSSGCSKIVEDLTKEIEHEVKYSLKNTEVDIYFRVIHFLMLDNSFTYY